MAWERCRHCGGNDEHHEGCSLAEPQINNTTLRDCDGEIHIECRFDNGEKYAAVTVCGSKPELATKINNFLNKTMKEK